jgi:putative transcriptional regulator
MVKMKYLHMRLPELLKEKGISRTKICKDLDLQRTNLNRYYRDEFQRIDASLAVRLCEYLDCDICDLLEIKDKEEN